MEAALAAMRGPEAGVSGDTVAPSESKVCEELWAAVPGAVLVNNVLTEAECRILAGHVKDLHTSKGQCKESSKPRRKSQHHHPIRVSHQCLGGICDRLRPFCPETAGPQNSARLTATSTYISPFLRCYYYKPGDFSAPHFDKSFTEHIVDPDTKKKGRLRQFSSYSVLIYLTSDFLGGETTFFHKEGVRISKSGLTPVRESEGGGERSLDVNYRVQGKAGDVLLFPHGNHSGCHPNPLHEGSILQRGEKLLIRTDLVFSPSLDGRKKRRKKIRR